MSGLDIPCQIAGLIGVTEDTIEAYDAIKDLYGLPKAFQAVNKRLLLVEQTLRDAKGLARKVKSSDAKALETLLESCEDKADKLLEIFKKIGKKSTDEYDFSTYWSIAAKLGKHRVEILLDGILGDLGTLAAYGVFQTAM